MVEMAFPNLVLFIFKRGGGGEYNCILVICLFLHYDNCEDVVKNEIFHIFNWL